MLDALRNNNEVVAIAMVFTPFLTSTPFIVSARPLFCVTAILKLAAYIFFFKDGLAIQYRFVAMDREFVLKDNIFVVVSSFFFFFF